MKRPSKVVLATNNAKKLVELRRCVAEAGLDVEILGLEDFPAYPPPAETEDSFDGNALIKAKAAAAATGLAAIADDSGIEVNELNDMPGVRSARWAGPEEDDDANLQLLLRQLDGVPQERRGARFVCALAFADPEGHRKLWHGVVHGHVTEAPRGTNGFGYDPIFVPEDHESTTAEMEPSEKDSISHRGQAVRSFLDWLKGS